MPNTLDFDVVFTELLRLQETGNFAVLGTIIAALLLYVLVVIFARRADKRDKAKVGQYIIFFWVGFITYAPFTPTKQVLLNRV